MLKYCLALAASLLVASSAYAWDGDHLKNKTPCFRLKAGKAQKFHYEFYDRGGFQAAISVSLGRCGRGYLGLERRLRRVGETSDPYYGEGDFRAKSAVDGSFYLLVNSASEWWTVERVR